MVLLMANKQGKCECGKMMYFNPLKFYGGWGCDCWFKDGLPDYDHDIDYSDMPVDSDGYPY
tara:strand:- start:214 stop:396 length:183 start_codon:yes stop_codon:yes gene_type:complete